MCPCELFGPGTEQWSDDDAVGLDHIVEDVALIGIRATSISTQARMSRVIARPDRITGILRAEHADEVRVHGITVPVMIEDADFDGADRLCDGRLDAVQVGIQPGNAGISPPMM